jgi:sec-independent protein translocase protein TatA
VFNIGSQEILIVLLLVFVLFGPRHIPEVAHALGKGLGDLRRALQGIEDVARQPDVDRPRPGATVPRSPAIKVIEKPPAEGESGDGGTV